MKRIVIVIIGCLLLSGCGFHPRRATDIPPQLHTLYLKTVAPYNPLVTQLRSMLTALNISLTKKPSQSPYILDISSISFTQSNPPITTTRLAVTFTYSLTVVVSVKDRHGHSLIGKKILNASRSISQNASQVYTPGTATLVKQELRRDIISQIYYVLISNNLRNALTKYVPKST